jgi:hypothetical protein
VIFAGYPRISSTGEIFTLFTPNPRIVSNTNVFANPHSPLTKKAQKAAKIHKNIKITT